MSYTRYASGGRGGSDSRSMHVYIYPNQFSDRSAAEGNGAKAAKQLCEQAMAHDAIDYYNIRIYDYHLCLGDSSKDALHDGMKRWVRNNTSERDLTW